MNFNKKFILKAVIHTKHDYSGVVAIDKSTGIVSTMLFGFKIDGKSNQISSKINSDVFCIKGEVNSKSLGITKNGDSCFKYNENGFELIDENKIEVEGELFPIKYKDNKFKCRDSNCNFIILNKEKYNKISRGSENNELKLMINERGFDTSYIDASDNNNILYIVRYSEGDEQEEILYLAYFLNGEFKTKLLRGIKSLEIFNSRDIIFNGHKVIFN